MLKGQSRSFGLRSFAVGVIGRRTSKPGEGSIQEQRKSEQGRSLGVPASPVFPPWESVPGVGFVLRESRARVGL